jgi:hypothetical protein
MKPNWIEKRAADFADACAYLRRRCVLVSVINRESAIRFYKVGGKRAAMMDTEVIEYAQYLKKRELRHPAIVDLGEVRA